MRRWIPVALILGTVWWWTRSGTHTAPDSVAKSKATPQVATRPASPKSSTPPEVKIEPAPIKERQSLESASERPAPPPEGLVEFQVKENGLAIAFGDVVMGKVAPGEKEPTGYARSTRTKLWESAEIPYSIREGVSNPGAVLEAMAYFARETPVRFVPFSGQKDSLVFEPSTELCASYLGRVGGAQPIFLSKECGVHEILHELMHALGFVHEHSRVDRDRYLEVVWANIDPRFFTQFWIVPDDEVHDYVGSVFQFDPESIMLYEPTAFAKVSGAVTLRSKMGQDLRPSRGSLSRVDRERVQDLYGN